MVFMYARGDCRSEILLPWASRSRSRTTDLLALQRNGLHALVQRIGRQKRHGERDHRRACGDGGEQHGENLRFEILLDQGIHDAAPQKSKLIILRITMMPTNIQMPQQASITRPRASVHKSSI